MEINNIKRNLGTCFLLSFFIYSIFIATNSYSQNNNINIFKFSSCENILVDLDSIYANVSDKKEYTIVIMRAESYFDDKSISIFENRLKVDVSSIFNVVIFEYTKTDDVNFKLIKVKNKGNIDETFIYPPRLFITSKNKKLLENMEEFGLAEYNVNGSFYQFISIENEEDFYSQLNILLLKLEQRVLNFSFQSLNKFYENEIDSLQSVIKKSNSQYLNNISIKMLFSNSTICKNSFKEDAISSSQAPSYEIAYSVYPFKNHQWLGVGLGFNLMENNFNTLTTYVSDTLTNPLYDQDGDLFYRVVYASDLKENIYWHSISLTPYLSFKIPLEKNWFASINPGLKMSNYYGAEYSLIDGSVSYGSIYPNYSSDTIFSGLYDNYQNLVPVGKKRKLKVNSINFGIHVPFSISVKLINNLWLSGGGFCEFGLTSLIKADDYDKFICSDSYDFNSSLYRYEKVKFNNYGFFIGINYRF